MGSSPEPDIKRHLVPISPLVFISSGGSSVLQPTEITHSIVGQKAFGLASLPAPWTLPFISISDELFSAYAKGKSQIARRTLVLEWTEKVVAAAQEFGIGNAVIIRSSGRGEDIATRGAYYSVAGRLSELSSVLAECLERLDRDPETSGESIPLLLQQYCNPLKARGHLSNERRCYEENRDWMGEFETEEFESFSNFQINLRHWREKFSPKLGEPLKCILSPQVTEMLKSPAEWAYEKGARIHFEWVWDGSTVYIVQADEEAALGGHDPVAEHENRRYDPLPLSPRVLRTVTGEDAKRYNKVHNVFTYAELELPTAPLFILDDRSIIEELAQGRISDALRDDIVELTRSSLVIRMDLATSDLQKRQLLPRTDDLRDGQEAINWIAEQSKIILETDEPGAFLFHNFIPAVAAAFAYAAPDERFVQIESLWGLPEGLYYNSHDKYVVDTNDTKSTAITADKISSFKVTEKANFKHFFVSTTETGNWETLTLKPPFDWRGTLSEADCQRIAYESRRIATSENSPLSIMWFIGVPPSVASCSVIPWHHEPVDLNTARPSFVNRTKTAFEKCFIIRNAADCDEFMRSDTTTSQVRRIRVQPSDEEMLRDKTTLKRIGEIAMQKNAVIVLEGAILSHAYYQLCATGAIVEVVNPFIGFEERREFNKLVRDRIPQLIQEGGEHVTTAKLDPETLVKALREKLVEEAYELLDAKDIESVVAELADVREVMDALTMHLKIDQDRVTSEQERKREKRGGFRDGIVLVETEKMPPTSRLSLSEQPHLEGFGLSELKTKVVDQSMVLRRAELLEKKIDRRISDNKVENITTFHVPVTRGTWGVETAAECIARSSENTVIGKAKGLRKGAQWYIEFSVSIEEIQLQLPLFYPEAGKS